MTTRIPAFIAGATAMLLASCERDQQQDVVAPTKLSRTSASNALVPFDAPAAMPANPTPRTNPTTALADRILELPDEDLADFIGSVVDQPDPKQRRATLTTIYEETDLRPPASRLPILLEIARSPDVHPDVRVTIMAELGATLQTNHGSSWGDWALALEEHLAETEGLIRVE